MALLRIVLDLLLPHDPGVVVYAERLAALDGVDGVAIDVVEEDAQTKTVEVTLEGTALPFEDITREIESMGGALHSVDQASAGKRIVVRRGIVQREER